MPKKDAGAGNIDFVNAKAAQIGRSKLESPAWKMAVWWGGERLLWFVVACCVVACCGCRTQCGPCPRAALIGVSRVKGVLHPCTACGPCPGLIIYSSWKPEPMPWLAKQGTRHERARKFEDIPNLWGTEGEDQAI